MSTERFHIEGVDRLIRGLKGIEKEAAPKAAARALNRTATQAKTKATRSIKVAMGLSKQKTVREGLRVNKARPLNLTASIVARGGFIPLIEFGARQVKAGVKHKVYGKLKLKPGAFIATMPNTGKRHVFIRKTKGRLPIQKQYGPSIPMTIKSDSIKPALMEFASVTLKARFEHELGFEVGKIIAKL